MSNPYTIPAPPAAPTPVPPAAPLNNIVVPPRRFLSSLRNRIIVAMVAVGFLSAIIGGILYQTQVSETIQKIDQRTKDDVINNLLTRVQNSRLGPRAIQQFEEFIQQNQGAVKPRLVVETALDRSIWVVGLVAMVASLLAWGLGWLLTRRIVRPLERLRQASHGVAGGDFSRRVPDNGDDEVSEVAHSFNLMAARLEGAEIKRRELLSDVAHELKTPLASIQGHIEALRDELPRAKADPQAIYDIVLEDVTELNRMVGSLRTWLNAQSMVENIELKPLALADELPALLERFRPQAEAAQVRLEMQLDPRAKAVLSDRNALRHMLSNLLDNALRYTPAGGGVRLQAWPGEGERPGQGNPGWITLAVSDTGIGIPPEHWPHLFERFYRVDKSRTRDTGGTGLGLALVRDLAQAQGGRVWLNSRVGQGTTFFITLQGG